MKKKQIVTLPGMALLCLAALWGCSAGNDAAVIPRPQQVRDRFMGRQFVFDGAANICYNASDSDAAGAAAIFAGLLERATGITAAYNGGGAKRAVCFVRDSSIVTEGEYTLEVSRRGVRIGANSTAGFVYGAQTLMQLIPDEAPYTVPAIAVHDWPRFEWRGTMLDVSRHFFPKEEILRFLDIMAMHKLNVFHWHLTDNHGWRLQIDKYPLLTEIAAWRADRSGQPWRGREPRQPGEETSYGGFYTKDDVREVIAYAAARGIDVVPEIEMPGHTTEVFAAYPQYSCAGVRTEVPVGSSTAGGYVFCAGDDAVFGFLEDIIDEVAELFPARYIHLGGDEVPKGQWKACLRCQARIKAEGLADEEGLQAYFMKRMAAYVRSKGKVMIGWDEILHGGLPEGAAVMSWHGCEGGLEAAALGHPVIMTPSVLTYLNFYQANPRFEPANRSAFVTSLRTAYSFDPVPAGMNEEDARMVMGGQACFWAEYIPDAEHLQYMALPRLGATAEALWTMPEVRSWDAFVAKQPAMAERYARAGYRFSQSSFRVDIEPQYDTRQSRARVAFSTSQYRPEIRYTTDGSMPAASSPLYRRPFTVSERCVVKAAIFRDGVLMEEPTEQLIVPHVLSFGCPVEYYAHYSEKYPAGGSGALTDGIRADIFRINEAWQGFDGEFDVTIDLGSVRPVRGVTLSFLRMDERRIVVPDDISVSIAADDGDYWEALRIEGAGRVGEALDNVVISDTFKSKGRYINIAGKAHGDNPLIMIDEVIIE